MNENTDNECFICFEKNNITLEQRLVTGLFGIDCINHPIIPLSHAYGCSCKTIFSHNKCLKNITKCPSCRKIVNIPNLHIQLYFEKYLIIFQNDILTILEYSVFFLSVICTFLIYLIEQFIGIIDNTYINFIYIAIYIYGIYIICYSKKIKNYWLYDENLNCFY
jgi:hypothetical protein